MYIYIYIYIHVYVYTHVYTCHVVYTHAALPPADAKRGPAPHSPRRGRRHRDRRHPF